MTSKASGNAIRLFVEKVNTSEILGKHNELKQVISGPLALAREKVGILESDEALAVFSRIEDDYALVIKRNVSEIFYEELERANLILGEIDAAIKDLHDLLDTTLQRILNEKQRGQDVSFVSRLYEDGRFVLVFLKLKTNLLRTCLEVPLDESAVKINWETGLEIEEGDFLLRCSKLETSCLLLVYDNTSSADGRVVPILSSMEEFLSKICEEFGSPEYKHIYTANGALISDVSLMRNDEILYASRGEPFTPKVLPFGCNGKDSASATDVPDIFQRKKSSDWVKLNVGGQLFYTSRTTLLNSDPDSMLARMFSPTSNLHPSCIDSNGAYLIDRDPRYFSPLLNYLRSGALILDPDINPKGVLEEAYFFNIQSCIPLLEPLTIPRDEAPLTRRDVINALIVTPNKDSLRFQGVNLNGADLSYLDLRNINFKYAKLRNAKLSYCNLSSCNFERADMTDVVMNCAVLSGVRLNGAIMENAKCLNCNFQDPSGHNANMEGVNLRNAALEDSDLTGANLRVANLKGANLKATILRGAILAGADLEKSDLTGSDLHEANLRGANLKDAALELMINPLHMSQAIR